jgi:hypothetical protein
MWLEDFVKHGGNEMKEKTKFYWCVPRSDTRDGLCLIQNDADIIAMMVAPREVKTLLIMVDHNFFCRGLIDLIVPIPSKYTGDGDGAEQEKEKYIDEEPFSSTCLSSVELHSEEEDDDDDDGDTKSDFYDSDYTTRKRIISGAPLLAISVARHY